MLTVCRLIMVQIITTKGPIIIGIFYTMFFYAVFFYAVFFYAVLFYAVFFYAVLFYAVFFYAVFFYAVFFYAVCLLRRGYTRLVDRQPKEHSLLCSF